MNSVFLAMFLITRLLLTQADAPELLKLAEAAYLNGNYTDAVVIYETVLDNGVQNGEIYFNLGSAYFQANNLGLAMLNYRRAQAYIPRDSDLNMGMALIRSQRLDLQGDDADLINGLANATIGLFTLSELSWLVLGLWILWFGIFLAHRLRPLQQDVLRISVIVAGILLLGGLVLLGSRLYASANRPPAVIINATAPAMSGPGTDYLELFNLHAGTELRILETRDRWMRFVLPDGRQGWLSQEAAQQV